MDWSALIWTVVWVVAGLVGLGLLIWLTVAIIGFSLFRKTSKDMTRRFNDF